MRLLGGVAVVFALARVRPAGELRACARPCGQVNRRERPARKPATAAPCGSDQGCAPVVRGSSSFSHSRLERSHARTLS